MLTTSRLSEMGLTETDVKCSRLSEPATSPRSSAQAAASRANGMRSKGPITVQGRHRSSQNALRHGLLAKRVAPLPDGRLERVDYDVHLEDLKVEFNPQTRSELNLVELLAADWVRLGRIRQHIEALLDPDVPDMSPPMHTADAIEPQVAVVEAMVESFEAGRSFCLSEDDMAKAAGWLRDVADILRSTSKQPIGYAGERDAQLHRQIKLPSLGVFKPGVIESFLQGQCGLSGEERHRWGLLLQRLLEWKRMLLANARNDEVRHERTCRTRQGRLINKIAELDLLQSYETKCRKAIERTTLLIRHLQGKRQT